MCVVTILLSFVANQYSQHLDTRVNYSGLALAILALGFFFALMLCIILKISFTLGPELFIIKKHGVFRSAKLEFALERTSLHYFRTHFSEEQVCKEMMINP